MTVLLEIIYSISSSVNNLFLLVFSSVSITLFSCLIVFFDLHPFVDFVPVFALEPFALDAGFDAGFDAGIVSLLFADFVPVFALEPLAVLDPGFDAGIVSLLFADFVPVFALEPLAVLDPGFDAGVVSLLFADFDPVLDQVLMRCRFILFADFVPDFLDAELFFYLLICIIICS